MSEQLYTPGENAKFLFEFTTKLREGNVGKKEVVDAHNKMKSSQSRDFISAVNMLVEQYQVDLVLKKSINKMLNVFYALLNERPVPNLKNNSFLELIIKDNFFILENTKQLRPLIKAFQNANEPDDESKNNILLLIENLSKVNLHYEIMENIVFPFLERQWPDHKCFQVLWSVHDDVRNELHELKQLLEKTWDLKKFNRLTGDLFFNIRTIIFREEKIILAAITEAGLEDALNELQAEAAEMGWSFIQPKPENTDSSRIKDDTEGKGKFIDFTTGRLTADQIGLIFNHLPVDITFVDENDTVKYFSTPPKRTFTRTASVVGRKVQNCHPPESVWMVEEILEAFRKGDQDEASFWIPFNEQFVYIQYFALRDSNGRYAGTIEVTQDVKEIRSLEGERRLLNWKPSIKD